MRDYPKIEHELLYRLDKIDDLLDESGTYGSNLEEIIFRHFKYKFKYWNLILQFKEFGRVA